MGEGMINRRGEWAHLIVHILAQRPRAVGMQTAVEDATTNYGPSNLAMKLPLRSQGKIVRLVKFLVQKSNKVGRRLRL